MHHRELKAQFLATPVLMQLVVTLIVDNSLRSLGEGLSLHSASRWHQRVQTRLIREGRFDSLRHCEATGGPARRVAVKSRQQQWP